MSTIIIVDDDPIYRELLGAALRDRGHRVIDVGDAESALFELSQHAIDVALIDISLPGMDGAALIREVRRRESTPVIAVTARSSPSDEIAALESGADGFVTKPAPAAQLDARIRALVRRADRAINKELVVGDITIRPRERHVVQRGKVIQLQRADMRLLVELASSPMVVQSRERLRERVYEANEWVAPGAIERQIARLRVALEDDPQNPHHIVTVQGVGYRFVS